MCFDSLTYFTRLQKTSKLLIFRPAILTNLLKGHNIFIYSALESEYRFAQFLPAFLSWVNGQPLIFSLCCSRDCSGA